jgi:hypothetical protein
VNVREKFEMELTNGAESLMASSAETWLLNRNRKALCENEELSLNTRVAQKLMPHIFFPWILFIQNV